MKYRNTIQMMLLAALLAGCGEKEAETVADKATNTKASPALQAVVDADVDGDAKAIHILRETAKPGDAVILSGRVMGSSKPFVEGRAAFMLGDPDVLTACSDVEGDECETPWDNCCDSKEDKLRGTATIQVVDADGKVLKEGIEGVGGIANLARLKVRGTVAEGSTSGVFVVNAVAIDISE